MPKPKKKTTKRRTPIPAVPRTPICEITPEQQIVGAVFLGKVKDYYAKPGVAALTLEAALAVGDSIRVKGHTTDLTQRVERLEIGRKSVPSAVAGESVGVALADRARIGDAVYKI